MKIKKQWRCKKEEKIITVRVSLGGDSYGIKNQQEVIVNN